MSEYEYDKNKPGQAAGAGNDPVSSDAGSGMNSTGRNAAPQNSGSGSDGAWENDDWSMRSSSVSDEDDPLIKLARLMEQNERNFEAAAQRSDPSDAGAPAAAYVPAADFAENQESDQAYHPEPQISAAAPPPEPSYRDAGFVPASDLAGQGVDPYAASATTVAEAPAAARPEQAAFRERANDEQYDPFAPGGSAQPLPERDFDVSRIPRAIRPAVSVDQSQMGGLHGSASPDQTEPESIAEPVAAVRTAPAAMAQADAQRPTSPLNEPVRPQPDPIAAELMRYVDANDSASAASSASAVQTASATGPLRGNVAPEYQQTAAQPPQAATQPAPQLQPQPASELGAASLPKADFSYLREVEDLRVPSRDAVNEEATDTSISNEDATSSEMPSTEEADILYDGYEEEDGGGLFASRGMMVAAGVMAFVLLGGGALLAYQAIFSGDDGGPPPLVLADKNPVRMLPDGQAADTSSGDIPLTSEGDVSNGVIQPGAETPIERINPNIDPDRAVRQIGANGNGTGSEGIAPRSVRTFKVNPDGSIVAEPAATNVGSSNAIQPRTVTTQQISGNGQVATATSGQTNAAPLPRARPNGASPAANTSSGSTGIQPRVVATNNTGTSSRADLPVAPRVSVGTNAPTFNQNAPAVQPATNTTTARVPSATVASTPAAAAQPAATAPAAATASGDFVVQVSSQRSEDAARSAFSGLQQRFPSVLGSLSPDIARADLGSRGVFYRVRVGPMETRVAAADFCQSLKSAGGDCIVARR